SSQQAYRRQHSCVSGHTHWPNDNETQRFPFTQGSRCFSQGMRIGALWGKATLTGATMRPN
ncbi:MAG: hypothetical protein ACPG97_11910, partial [Paracoccaceae bacterium]